jgi:hypothetical protein
MWKYYSTDYDAYKSQLGKITKRFKAILFLMSDFSLILTDLFEEFLEEIASAIDEINWALKKRTFILVTIYLPN